MLHPKKVGSIPVEGSDEIKRTNEIKIAAPLLDTIEIEGKTITADALLTQRKYAEYLVKERKAHYHFTTKVSSQFRIALDSNHYSVPAEYSGSRLTVKTYADRLCIYDHDKLVALHPRSYDRHRDFEDPDHPKELLAQRKKIARSTHS